MHVDTGLVTGKACFSSGKTCFSSEDILLVESLVERCRRSGEGEVPRTRAAAGGGVASAFLVVPLLVTSIHT